MRFRYKQRGANENDGLVRKKTNVQYSWEHILINFSLIYTTLDEKLTKELRWEECSSLGALSWDVACEWHVAIRCKYPKQLHIYLEETQVKIHLHMNLKYQQLKEPYRRERQHTKMPWSYALSKALGLDQLDHPSMRGLWRSLSTMRGHSYINLSSPPW